MNKFHEALKAIKKSVEETGGGQGVMTFKGSKIIGGWNFAIVVEAPDFIPEEGQFSIGRSFEHEKESAKKQEEKAY